MPYNVLNVFAARPTAKPSEAAFARYVADFANNRYATRKQQLSYGQAVKTTSTGITSGSTSGTVFYCYAHNADGTLKKFPQNVARKTTKGLLVEGAGANKWFNSRNYSNASWWVASTGMTAGQTSPFGDNGAFRYNENSNTSVVRNAQAQVVVAGETGIFSWMVKKGTFDICTLTIGNNNTFTNADQVWFNINTGAALSRAAAAGTGYGYLGHGIQALGGGWFNIWMRLTVPAATTTMWARFSSASADGSTNRNASGVGQNAFIENVMWDVTPGITQPGSPLVCTTNSAVSRQADTVTLRLPAALTGNLTVTFDDASTATIVAPSGTHTLSTTYGKYIASIKSTGTAYAPPAAKHLVADFVDGASDWTDNCTGFYDWLEDVKGSGGGVQVIPGGDYGIAGTMEYLGDSLAAIELTALSPVTLVWTNATPIAVNLHLGSVNAATAPAASVKLTGGVACRLNRASVRTDNFDHIRIRGTSVIHCDWSILSADNNGLAIGRSDPNTFRPTKIYLYGNAVYGGWNPASGTHTRGSIGCTNIWITSLPVDVDGSLEIRDLTIQYSGDDGLYIGHIDDTLAKWTTHRSIITNLTIRYTYAGIGVGCSWIKITGCLIEDVSWPGIRFENDSAITTQVADDCRSEGNVIRRIGFVTAGDINSDLVPVSIHAVGIWMRGNRNYSVNDVISYTRQAAYKIEPAATASGRTVQTGCRIINPTASYYGVADKAGSSFQAHNIGLGFIRRSSGAGVLPITDLQVTGATVSNSVHPLVGWQPDSATADGTVGTPLVFEFTSVSGMSWAANPAVWVAASGSGRVYATVTCTRTGGQAVATTPKTVTGGTAVAGDVTVTGI